MSMFAPGSGVMPLRDRSLIVAVVVLVHVSLLWSWAALPSLSKPAHHEMSVSVVMSSAPQPAMAKPQPPRPALPQPQPAARPMPVEPQRVQPQPPVEQAAAPAETPAPASPAAANSTPAPAATTAPTQMAAAAPGLPDTEPDYRASYLNNPKPPYPTVAQRMGWEGKVMLNVEVLASGLPGQISVRQSSGHEVLDRAALQAVRTWRFVPARHGGQAITKEFPVPVRFVNPKETE
ncbi:MAG TPA: energy transducer TonB [Gallionella sp.]|nr:energy transducer TonB [Gallionella sp.]